MGHYHGASTPTHPAGVDPVSNPACEIFPTTALHAPCWFTLIEGPQPGPGGEQSKHTPRRSQESLGGKCRAIYCCQGTCCLLGARSSSPDAPQRCKEYFQTFRCNLLAPGLWTRECPAPVSPRSCLRPQSLRFSPRTRHPSPASMAGSAWVRAGCTALGLEPGSAPLG